MRGPCERLPHAFLEQSPDKDPEDEDRQHVLEVRLHPARHLHAGPRIDLRHVLIEAPAIAGGTEEDEEERAAGKDKARDEEVFRIKDAACTQEVDVLPNIEAKDAGNGTEEYEREQDEDAFFAAPAKVVHAVADETFKDRRDGREARKGHEEEEESAPELSHRHMDENIRQRHENKGRSFRWSDAEGKAGRENDEPAMMATKVSKIVMRTASPVSELSLLM